MMWFRASRIQSLVSRRTSAHEHTSLPRRNFGRDMVNKVGIDDVKVGEGTYSLESA
jgi:hypothetical protein